MNWLKKIAACMSGDDVHYWIMRLEQMRSMRDMAISEADLLTDALEEIAAIQVTAQSNGSLRKAVRIAREALEK